MELNKNLYKLTLVVILKGMKVFVLEKEIALLFRVKMICTRKKK